MKTLSKLIPKISEMITKHFPNEIAEKQLFKLLMNGKKQETKLVFPLDYNLQSVKFLLSTLRPFIENKGYLVEISPNYIEGTNIIPLTVQVTISKTKVTRDMVFLEKRGKSDELLINGVRK